MLSRRALTHRTLLLDFLAPSTICRVSQRASRRSLHGDGPAKPSHPVPTPEDRSALFNSLRRIVKDRRHDVKLTNNQIDQFHRDLQKWRVGMLDGDLATVVGTLREFKQKKLAGLITQRDWKELAYFVSNAMRPSSGHDLKDPSWEELAVDAAAADGGGNGEAAFALKKLLLAMFKAGNFDGVLELYNRFISEARSIQCDMQRVAASRAGARAVDGQQPPENADEDGQDEAAHTYLQYSPGLFDLHLCALAAHHARGSFGEALEAVVGLQLRFVPSAINNFCSTAYDALDSHEGYERAASFTVFIEQIKTARSIMRPRSLAQEIRRIQNEQDSQRLLAQYDTAVRACHDSPNWFRQSGTASTSASTSTDLPLRLHETIWAAFLSAFGNMRMIKNVQAAWQEMRTQGIEPTQTLWNEFLLAHATSGHAADSLTIWREMVELGKIDIVSYSTVMKAYNTFGLVDDAIKLFDYLLQIKWRTEAGGRAASEDSRRRVCNVMLDGLLSRAQAEASQEGAAPQDNPYFARAEKLLADMQTSGPAPDLYSHNAFLLYHARNGDVPAAAGLLRTIAQNGLTPDTASFTIVLQALLRVEHPNASKVTLDLMRAFGVVPETPVYSAILSSIMGVPGERHVTEALGVLDEMEVSERARPDERTYSVMLAGLFRQRGLTPQRTAQIENDLQRRMVKARINLGQLSYNHIVCACLEPAADPSELMIDAGLRYYREMIRRGAMPNNKAWMLVLTALSGRDLKDALEVIQTMQQKSVRGDGPLRKLVERVQRQAASAGYIAYSM